MENIQHTIPAEMFEMAIIPGGILAAGGEPMKIIDCKYLRAVALQSAGDETRRRTHPRTDFDDLRIDGQIARELKQVTALGKAAHVVLFEVPRDSMEFIPVQIRPTLARAPQVTAALLRESRVADERPVLERHRFSLRENLEL